MLSSPLKNWKERFRVWEIGIREIGYSGKYPIFKKMVFKKWSDKVNK
ncbi:15983_t:CDS:2 [Rhizophagus irregularis]|nr:15983_t:CDS:2 [Rhizophagus irregularis]